MYHEDNTDGKYQFVRPKHRLAGDETLIVSWDERLLPHASARNRVDSLERGRQLAESCRPSRDPSRGRRPELPDFETTAVLEELGPFDQALVAYAVR